MAGSRSLMASACVLLTVACFMGASASNSTKSTNSSNTVADNSASGSIYVCLGDLAGGTVFSTSTGGACNQRTQVVVRSFGAKNFGSDPKVSACIDMAGGICMQMDFENVEESIAAIKNIDTRTVTQWLKAANISGSDLSVYIMGFRTDNFDLEKPDASIVFSCIPKDISANHLTQTQVCT